jgi:hypothetical protein
MWIRRFFRSIAIVHAGSEDQIFMTTQEGEQFLVGGRVEVAENNFNNIRIEIRRRSGG